MKLTRNAGAFPCPMGYSADLYCKWENDSHGFQEFPHSYMAETRGGCLKQARAQGWIIHRDNYATCPKCRAALKEMEKTDAR